LVYLAGLSCRCISGTRLFSAKTGPFKNMALKSVQNVDEGFISVDTLLFSLKGKTGVASTVLRPGGKVEIDGEMFRRCCRNRVY
jgi:membrane-bound serine protease (ClpP class)